MEENKKTSIFARPVVQSITGIIIIALLVIGALVYKSLSSRISTDRAQVSAPIIAIGPESEGILNEVYVKVGDTVTPGESLAQVGSELLTAKVAGVVVAVSNTPGQVFAPSQAVVQMVDPTQLRVVGTIKENEGLADIKAGDPVSFTVDAFKGKTYTGVVESVTPSADQSGVAFSISDKREVKDFTVTVAFDTAAHPEFKNGMSAKIKIYHS